jgi:hypothetical protein
MRKGEPDSVRRGALQFYAVFTVLLLASPFTENIHFTWVVPAAGLLFVVMAQERRWHPWHAIAIGTYLVLALPFTEYLDWQAGTSLLGRLSSGIDCYGLVILSWTLCFIGFRARPRSPSSQQARLLPQNFQVLAFQNPRTQDRRPR